jgi:hypothetical protein
MIGEYRGKRLFAGRLFAGRLFGSTDTAVYGGARYSKTETRRPEVRNDDELFLLMFAQIVASGFVK